MVRSKFPGKPSKIINRKIVNSSKYTLLQDNESTKAAENISYGLAVFNEVFGDNDQVLTAFHGFSPHEVDKAQDIAKKQWEKVLIEYSSSGAIHKPEDAIPIKLEAPTPQALSQMEANLDLIGPVGRHTTRAQHHSLSSDILNDFSKPVSPSKYFTPFKGNHKKHVANRLLQRAKRSSLDGPSMNRTLLSAQLDKNGTANATSALRKFVLPSHSIRSSRVIKPNKRFLDSEENVKEQVVQTVNPMKSRTIELKKPRLILDNTTDFHLLGGGETKCSTSDISFTSLDCNSSLMSNVVGNSGDGKQHWKHVKLGELNVFGAPTTQPTGSRCSNSLYKDGDAMISPQAVPGKKPVPSSKSSPSKSKLILRESKLNVSAPAEKLQEGIFSRKPKKGLATKASASAIECEVCGAVRLYRLAKQAHKFGINSCEPCRKFVARMIIKAKSSENSVSCEKGQGNCAITLTLNKNESITSKIHRCLACWLLMCIQRFVSMPEQTRDSLIRMLPANMQGMTVIVPTTSTFSKSVLSRKKKRPQTSSSHQSLNEQSPRLPGNMRKSQTPMSRIRRKAALASLANNLRRAREKTVSSGPSTRTSPHKNSSSGDRLNKAKSVKKISHMKKSQTLPKTAEKPGRKAGNKILEKGKDGFLRQKLSLKGPRVKHVCRSASIVLGQPMATFPVKNGTSPSKPCSSNFQSDKGAPSQHDVSSDLHECKLSSGPKEACIKSEPHNVSSAAVEPEQNSHVDHHILSASAASEAERKFSCKPASSSNTLASGRRISGMPSSCSSGLPLGFPRGHRRTLQDLTVNNTQLDSVPELVTLDFWESYDPDEVCNTGFGLIGFEPFSVKPVCFLCGSAGKRKLIHCASCCEPYHQFCVEMGVAGSPVPPIKFPNSGREEWRVDWVCPRCTVCHGCGRSTGHQLTSCQRCHNSYHLDCLGSTSLRKTTGDRLWICSSCLRCKSCNSAVVTKFVGNLPFCKVCFKLRQKGNFCPLCQGCYTDDDYQSKMMECAECKAWVHAKCEGLSDEKYQVLSYLPESVEYVCRLCCTFPPAPWWLAVEAELQAGYINIVKAITKNRKACAMLKWSPKRACNCQQSSVSTLSTILNQGISLGKRRLSFNHEDEEMEIQIPPSTMRKISQETNCDNSSINSKITCSIFEFDDDIDAGENAPITKYINSREKSSRSEYSGLQPECGNEGNENADKGAQYSPNTGSQSDSGIGSTDDELKVCSAAEEEDVEDKKIIAGLGSECLCSNRELRHTVPSLLTVKKKVHSSEYSSLLEFHQDMDQLISEADSHEVKELYHQTLQEVFPWFDPKYTRVSRNSLPTSPSKPYHGSLLQYQQGGSPEKNGGNLSSFKILESLIPKDVDVLNDDYFYNGMTIKDERVCCFCKLSGDSDPNDEGRLLYCGQNDWVHINCALWSAEVFEEIDGALQNVHNALSRGRMIRCSKCGKKGASVGCCAKKCEETLHFPCARKAGFVFMEDKNVYCPVHLKDAPGKPLTKPSEFDIYRPVFVELDRRKKKSIESKHVRVMIGSLVVESLGTIVPEMSDLGSVIVPTQFNCTRLFWSSKEPWRVVQYTICTTLRLPAPEPVLDLGHHVTVDHSKENDCNTLEGIAQAHLSKDSSLTLDSEQEIVKSPSVASQLSSECKDKKVIEAVVNQLLDTVCNKEVDEEVSDAQNSADLLPPELKDAIFEDLPHDFLDGISMQDIFQDKFLNFEDLSKDDTQEEAAGSQSNAGCTKEQSNKEKSKLVKSLKAVRELKRSKSDVLPSSSSQTSNRLHQRSCSLAWSCKLGTSISCCKVPRGRSAESIVDRTRLIQELRLSVKPASSVELKYCLQDSGDKGKENHTLSWPRIMQVDGVYDLSGSDSSDVEDGLLNDTGIRVSDIKFTSNMAKDSELLWNRIECLKKVTSATFLKRPEYVLGSRIRKKSHVGHPNKFKTELWQANLSQDLKHFHIPQFDGAADIPSDSDVASNTQSKPHNDEKPVRCGQCRCTYRTAESYTRHLPSCLGDYSLTTSESEAEVSEDEAAGNKKPVPGLDHSLAPSPDSAISVSSGSLISVPLVSPVSSGASPLLPITTSVSCASSSAPLGPPRIISQNGPALTSVNSSQVILVEQVPASSNMGNLLPAFPQVSDRVAEFKPESSDESSHHQTIQVLVDRNQSVIQEQNAQQSLQQTVQPSSQQSSPVIMLDYQQSQQTGPTVLVQSVPSAAMVPTFLEAYQQHSGHNLQYLTTLDTSGGFGKTQYLAAVPSSVVPGAYQLQAVPDGQLCVDPCTVGISTLPGIQLAPTQLPPPQPQVLGTLIQSSLPCGVVATTEPMYETIQMYPDQSGGVLLTSQPMLTCMETVVSNTYMSMSSMSSSQFISSSVPGMLEGSSTYSTTTTQVFQSGEVETPVVDVPTQYVMVNPQSTLRDQSRGKMGVVSVHQQSMQEQTAVKTHSQIPISSINLPMPASVPAPIPPQTLPSVIPTSVVPPMPRIQPQRTYSKPTKISKKGQASSNGVVISNVSKKSNFIVTSKDKKTLVINTVQLLNSAKGYQGRAIHPKVDSDVKKQCSVKKLPVGLSSKCAEAPKTVESVSEHTVLEFVATNTAPAQSITLPDPIPKLIVDEAQNSTDVISGTPVGASGRCPTFSYRSQIVAKSQKKTGFSQPNAVLVSKSATNQSPSVTIVQCPGVSGRKEAVKINGTQMQMSTGHPLIIISPKSSGQSVQSTSSICSSVIALNPSKPVKGSNSLQISSTPCATFSSSGNGKPVATIIPQTQVRVGCKSTSSSTPQLNEVSSIFRPVTSHVASNPETCVDPDSRSATLLSTGLSKTSCVVPYQPDGNNALKCSAPSPTSCSTSLSYVAGSYPLLASLISTKCNPVSSEALGVAATTSQTMLINGTTTSFLSQKPLVSTGTGLKPLQEIKTANVTNVEGHSSPSRVQDKLLVSVPPTVLKSTCNNFDLSKKNDLFNKQEVPVIFASAEKSPTSLKLLFQKQAHSGCYKVSSSPVEKDDELTLVKLADINIMSLNQKKSGKDESENVQPIVKVSKKPNTSAPQLMYEINGQDGFTYTSTSMSDVWQKVFDAVQEARAKHKMPPLLHNPFGTPESAPNLLGLGNNSLKYLMEQLHRVEDCRKYRPIYHKSRLPGPGYRRDDLDTNFKESSSGCARTDPCMSLKKYDMFSWLDSRHRCPPRLLENSDFDSLLGGRRATSTNLPMAMRFRHLRETSRTSVGVFRSDIHGRGLFCLRDIEAGEMVIEYAGEVIRNTLTDNRERYYQSKGIDCYMFKVDDNCTVDATRKGNAARFINHSCEPNCYSRVVDIHGKKHIIIFAYRRIPQGEELTYDYKFPIEDVKIACHCLAPRCRKYLN